jgi:hypothetical protein
VRAGGSTTTSICGRARFGDVLVVEPDGVEIEAVTDESPVVVLDGAPRTVGLTELGGNSSPVRGRRRSTACAR